MENKSDFAISPLSFETSAEASSDKSAFSTIVRKQCLKFVKASPILVPPRNSSLGLHSTEKARLSRWPS